MTAVAVTPSATARARTAAHTSSGMRTVRAGVFGWFGMSAGEPGGNTVDLHGSQPRLHVEDGCASGVCGAARVDSDACLLVGGGLCGDGIHVDSVVFVGGADFGGDWGNGVVCHGFTVRGVLHLVNTGRQTP